MMTFVAAIRTVILVFFCLCYFVQGAFGWILHRDPLKRRRYFARNVTRYVKFGLWCFGTKVKAVNVPPEDKNFLFVGNHLGFLDVFVAASVRPILFITSYEMKNTPFLGQCCEMGGCLFVERRNRGNIHNEIGEIRQGLKDGFSIALYPEGTSGHGAHLLPFKKSLLTSAVGTGVAIKPMVVNYTRINGEPMSHKWREYVAWYGDQTFVPSIWKLLTVKSLEAEIEYLPEVVVHSEEERREVAAKLHAMISARYRPIEYPPGEEPPTLQYASPTSRPAVPQ